MDIESSNPPGSQVISYTLLRNSLASKASQITHLDLKKLRQERLLNKTTTPKFENAPIDTLFKINSIEEELKHYKSSGKTKQEDSKLVFSKDFRPKSAIRGSDDTNELIKLAETAANLLKHRKNTLDTVLPTHKEKSKSPAERDASKKNSTRGMAVHSGYKGLIKTIKKDRLNANGKKKAKGKKQ